MHGPHPPHAPPDSFLRAVWVLLMENAQWVCVTLIIALLLVVIVPPMIGSQHKAYDTVAQSCAAALQGALQLEGTTSTLPVLVEQEHVQAACAAPTLHVTPLQQPSMLAMQDSRGHRTYIVTLTGVGTAE